MFHGSTSPELKTRGTNWKTHTEGVTMLTQVRGPHGLVSENARLLFKDSRLSAVRCQLPVCGHQTPVGILTGRR